MFVRCPLCNSDRVRWSQFVLRKDFVHLFFLHRACRCRQCGVRFYGPVWQRVVGRLDDADKPQPAE